MILAEYEEQHYIEYILNYANDSGLYSLVQPGFDLNEEKNILIIELQPELITAFLIKFPDSNLDELKNAVKWILLTALQNKR